MVQNVKSDCTGCNACVAVCKANAIEISYDAKGFWYPKIDGEKCIECGLCQKKCPAYQKERTKGNIAKTYISWSLNEDIRLKSSSGGIFSELAEFVLLSKGYVIGAAFDEEFNSVKHIIIESVDDLKKVRGSKYVQSYISEEIYHEIERKLICNELILFSGTPCQVAGLYKFLGKEYDSLITVDLVCHGVPSPMAWQKYIKFMSELNKQNPQEISFRSKRNGWQKFEMNIRFDNNEYSRWFNKDLWGLSFITNMFLRECCYKCKFKDENRIADISLGDFWKAPKKYDYDDKGCSLLIINSEKGGSFIQNISGNLFMEQIGIQAAYPGNYALYKSSDYFEQRESAFKLLKTKDFKSVVRKYTKQTILGRIAAKLRKIQIIRSTQI